MALDVTGPPRAWAEHWNASLRWIAAPPPPDDDVARIVHDAVARRRLSTFGAVATELAETLFVQDRRHVGPAADIGFFASWYLVIACRALERLCATSLELTSTAAPAEGKSCRR